MKKLLHSVISGFGVALGVSLFNKLIRVAKDPVKRAQMKKKFTNIKNEVFKKEEEE